MATKTFKIGEVCQGGIITVEITKTQIKVIGKEWNHENGGRRRGQKNNKEWTREEFDIDSSRVEHRIENYISGLATSWWADNILKWIKTKVEFKANPFW